MEKILVENELQQAKLLAAINDDHDGVIVELSEHMHTEDFASMLKASIVQWRKQRTKKSYTTVVKLFETAGKRGVWIKVPIELVNLVEVAVKEGFWYHHAEPKYLMLIYWIPEGTHTLPANASHRVSIAAFVMNEKREVLVVQEKSGIFRGKGLWKFPTGSVDEGEDICVAAVREVKEETDIDTKFVEVLAFRQSHRAFFGKSDLSFICLLQPLSFEIEKQESEIEAAQWMSLDEYVAQPYFQKSDLSKYMLDICLAKVDKKYSGCYPVPVTSNISDENGLLYVNNRYLRKTARSGLHVSI